MLDRRFQGKKDKKDQRDEELTVTFLKLKCISGARLMIHCKTGIISIALFIWDNDENICYLLQCSNKTCQSLMSIVIKPMKHRGGNREEKAR